MQTLTEILFFSKAAYRSNQ